MGTMRHGGPKRTLAAPRARGHGAVVDKGTVLAVIVKLKAHGHCKLRRPRVLVRSRRAQAGRCGP